MAEYELVDKYYRPGTIPQFEDGPQYRCCCRKVHVRHGAIVIGIAEIVMSLIFLVNAIQSLAMDGPTPFVAALMEIFYGVGFAVVCALMLFGIWKEKKEFILPHLVWSIAFIILSGIAGICVLVSWFIGGITLAVLGAKNFKNTFSTDYLDAVDRRINRNVTKAPEDYKVDYDNCDDDAAFERENSPCVEYQVAKSGVTKQILMVVVIGCLLAFLIFILLEIWFFIIVRACYRYIRDKQYYMATHNEDEAEGIPMKEKV